MKRITKILTYLALAVLVIACLASCEQLLSNGVSTHEHEYGAWGNDTATCENGGKQTRVCSICNEVQTRKTQALGHDYVSYKDREANCTQSGYTNYEKCSRCDSEKGTVVEALGHTMSKWTGNTATCLAGGKEFAECTVCGFDDERATKPLGHNIDSSRECTLCHKHDIVVLIKDGIANFNVVYTTKSRSKATADYFVERLNDLGIEVDASISDSKAPTKDYEIIIGADALNRGDDCAIGEKYLGNKGTAIKIVGNKIIIAGGTSALTNSAFETFVSEVLGINSNTKTIDYLEVDSTCCYENLTSYVIKSIKIGNNDLADYKYVYDVSAMSSGFTAVAMRDFRDNIYDLSGIWMPSVHPSQMVDGEKYFIVRYVDDPANMDENGFRAYIDGDDFIIECAYQNVFNDTFTEFVNSEFLLKIGTVEIAESFDYKKQVSIVYYEDFEAKGDGSTCDWQAIYNTHMFANAGGQKVMSRGGKNAVYYISAENFTKTIPVKTNVDFCGATFRINDRGEAAYKYRKLALFTLERDYGVVKFIDNDKSIPVEYIDEKTGETKIKYESDNYVDDERFRDVSFKVGETDFSWLSEELVGTKNLVKIWNENHKDFTRHGANQNSGAARRDVFVVNADGTVDTDSAPVFDFDVISVIEIYRADDKPITVENGNFINICCRAVGRTLKDENGNEYVTYANVFHEYQRGFIVNRSNATIKNVKHSMEREPDLGWYPEESEYNPDTDTINTATYGSRYESYPYYGFVFVNHIYNFTLSDSQLTGHSTYYEDKPATASTGWETPAPVPMGSYDFVFEYSSKITFKNVIQVNTPDQQSSADNGDYAYLTDNRYWGIMSSNGVKNLEFTGCAINRFDAHRGFWNAKLSDTYIGHSFQVIGGGLLEVDNVTKGSKSNFMTFRGDYGATFEGDIIITNSKHEARAQYNSWKSDQTPRAIGSISVKDGSKYYSRVYLFACSYATSNSGYTVDDPSGGYWLWDFGYTCYMPITVTIDNFTSLAKDDTYIFTNLPDKIFEKTYVEGVAPTKDTVRYPYQITQKIIQKNMSALIPTCSATSSSYSKIRRIPVESSNIG